MGRWVINLKPSSAYSLALSWLGFCMTKDNIYVAHIYSGRHVNWYVHSCKMRYIFFTDKIQFTWIYINTPHFALFMHHNLQITDRVPSRLRVYPGISPTSKIDKKTPNKSSQSYQTLPLKTTTKRINDELFIKLRSTGTIKNANAFLFCFLSFIFL